MTKSHAILMQSYVEESIAGARCETQALRADKDERPDDARLFRALATARKVHATKALMLLRGRIGDTDEGIDHALGQIETFVEGYRQAVLSTEVQEDPSVEPTVTHFLKTALNHQSLLRTGAPQEDLHVCSICGFIAKGDVPWRCPVCHAVPTQFTTTE